MLIATITCAPIGIINVEANQKPITHQKNDAALSKSNGQKKDKSLEGLTQYVEELMKRLPVMPGLAIAVVMGDRVIFVQGFGYRNVKRKLPVTPQTLFYIASAQKSFTATTAKILADEGKLDLDVPVRTYFPNLILAPPLSADHISLRDLLVHKSGISNDPLEFRTSFSGQSDKEEMLKLLNTASRPIPRVFTYSNIGNIITGYAMENATGESFQQLIQKKILNPLGMNDTTFSASKAKASSNVALPYLSVDGLFIELPYKEDNTMQALGGMVSTADDLAKWLIMNMNKGTYQGKQIISAVSLAEIHSAQINQKKTSYKFNRYAYGLGWDIANYEGDVLLHRFGAFPGFRPHVSFMPAHNLGVIVLANESDDGYYIPDVIASDIYDHLLRKKPFQVSSNPKVEEQISRIQKRVASRKQRAAKEQEANTGSKSTLELKEYTGVYESPEYGRIVITMENGSLVVKCGNLSAVATHSEGDVFHAIFFLGDVDKLTFTANQKVGVTKLFAQIKGYDMFFAKVH
jgi:CubicO group peptidase (beta-lactamase class C family)